MASIRRMKAPLTGVRAAMEVFEWDPVKGLQVGQRLEGPQR